MNTIESPQPAYVILGGGTTGEAAAGVLDARQGAVVYAGVITTDSGSWTGKLRTMELDPSGYNDRPAIGDLRRSSSALSAFPAATVIFEQKLGIEATVSDVDYQGAQLLKTIAGKNPRISADRAAMIIENTSILARKVSEQSKGNLKGLNLGHLVMTQLTIEHGNVDSATQETGDLLNTRGIVVPMTLESVQLVQQDGPLTIVGEHIIDERTPVHRDEVRMSLSRPARLNPRLRIAMLGSNAIILGPGSMSTSVLAGLLHSQTAETLAEAQDNDTALAFNVNLDNQASETSGWTAARHVSTCEDYLAPDRRFDVVVINDNTKHLDSEKAVSFDKDDMQSRGYKVVTTDLVRKVGARRQANDMIKVRANAVHDMSALGKALVGSVELDRSRSLACA